MGSVGTKALLSVTECFFTPKLKKSALIEELLLLALIEELLLLTCVGNGN